MSREETAHDDDNGTACDSAVTTNEKAIALFYYEGTPMLKELSERGVVVVIEYRW